MKKKSLLKFQISTGIYSSFVDQIINNAQIKQPSIVCVANVHMFIEAYKNPDFIKLTNDADLVTSVGMPLLWGLKILKGITQTRVAEMDLLPDLVKEMESKDIAAFFYGGTHEMLNN